MKRLTSVKYSRMTPEFCTEIECLARDFCPGLKKHNRLFEYEETGMTPEEITAMVENIEGRFLAFLTRRYGLDGGKVLSLLEAYKLGRVIIVPRAGDVLFKTDPEHGVVKHTVTDIHWCANTNAEDDKGNAWADYYTNEDIETAHRTREAAEEVLQAGSIMEGFNDA